MIRAKFRCMSISNVLNNEVVIKLLPVIPKKGLPNFEENKQFWEYSPSGECIIGYRGMPMIQGENDIKPAFEVGSFYFIDMEKQPDLTENPPGYWSLERREENLGSTTVVNFRLGWVKAEDPSQFRHGFLSIGLSDKAVAARDAFGAPACGWSIGFHFAHGAEAE